MKLAAALADWIAFIQSEKGLSRATLEAYRGDVVSFLEHVEKEGSECALLTRSAYEAWWNGLTGLAPSSLARKRSATRSFLLYGEREGWVDPPFTPQVESWHFRPSTPDYLTQDEVARLLAPGSAEAEGAHSPDSAVTNFPSLSPQAQCEQLLMVLLAFLGLRVSEACGLRLGDLDAREGLLRVQGKGDKIRLLPVPAWLLGQVETWLSGARLSFPRKSDALLCTGGGMPLTRQQAWAMVKARARRAHIQRPVHPHLLRHSFATQLLTAGAGLRSVQELLGHEDVRTTERYTHVTAEHLRRTVENCHPHMKRQGA